MSEFKLIEIDFNTFDELWNTALGTLLPKNLIYPVDHRQYLGILDTTILENYKPIFLAIQNSKGSYSAFISGHATSLSTYRVRGLSTFGLKQDEEQICVKILLDTIEFQAKKASCTMLWDLVSLGNKLLNYDFQLIEEFKDGLWFVSRKI